MRAWLTAGRGPREVRDFVTDLGHWLVDQPTPGVVLARHPGALELDLPPTFRAWAGTHLLLDPSRGRGARRRWYAALHLLPEPPAHVFDPAQVCFRADRSGGPGGQHVNTTASAVRATYPPLGLSVRVAEERSQHRNRALALARLQAAARALHDDATLVRTTVCWQAHDRVVRGDPVARWTRRAGRLVPLQLPTPRPPP